ARRIARVIDAEIDLQPWRPVFVMVDGADGRRRISRGGEQHVVWYADLEQRAEQIDVVAAARFSHGGLHAVATERVAVLQRRSPASRLERIAHATVVVAAEGIGELDGAALLAEVRREWRAALEVEVEITACEQIEEALDLFRLGL